MDPYFIDLIDRYTDNIISENDTIYAIRVIGRGETLFFRENGKCLLCSIDAEHGIIYKKSIKSWDSTDEKMDRSEKERVTNLIYKFYKQIYNPDAMLI
ncbi:MAG: hypothetical protein EOO39_06985 [Cytophagaceae bacterium]|nr:MAG: hypothetical protein EOO39_06985 [Cytophagaceae bacterium]